MGDSMNYSIYENTNIEFQYLKYPLSVNLHTGWCNLKKKTNEKKVLTWTHKT